MNCSQHLITSFNGPMQRKWRSAAATMDDVCWMTHDSCWSRFGIRILILSNFSKPAKQQQISYAVQVRWTIWIAPNILITSFNGLMQRKWSAAATTDDVCWMSHAFVLVQIWHQIIINNYIQLFKTSNAAATNLMQNKSDGLWIALNTS